MQSCGRKIRRIAAILGELSDGPGGCRHAATVVRIHIANNVQSIYKQCSFCKEHPAGKSFTKITYVAKAGKRPRQPSRAQMVE